MTYTEFIIEIENNIAKANCNKLNIGEYEEKQKQIYKQIRADSIDEFAKRLKAECRIHYVDCDPYFGGIQDSILYEDDIDEIAVQEVAEEYNGGWISCSERLPKYGEVVMCSCTNSGITISCITHKGVKPSKSVRFGQHSVSAWMPLPQPYKESD